MTVTQVSDMDSAIAESFRATMRRFPATVTVITARQDLNPGEGARDHGMTVTAVTSVSMDPPSLLVCLNNRTLLHHMLLDQAEFAVNVLDRRQAHISDAFSGKLRPEDRFETGGWERRGSGLLVLPSAHANIVCRRIAAIPFATHTVFIGQVLSASLDTETSPLLYENASYCATQPAALAG